jgi:tripartite-type tricarboxylate transporter receptor subunit TctC
MTARRIVRINRRLILKAMAVSVCPHNLLANEAFPSRNIRLIVPFAAGGGTDTLARLLAAGMSTRLGQQVVVENLTGAGGAIGAMQVARATPDGHTLMIGTPGSILSNSAMHPDLKYSAQNDFIPISKFSDSPVVLIANKDVPWTSAQEFLAAARSKPGSINYGSAGQGSIEHLSTEMFQLLTKVQMQHVPYRGTSQSLTDLRSGAIQVIFENLPPVLKLIQAKEVKAFAIGSKERSKFLPDLPTLSESIAPGYDSTSWTGLFAPTGTPAAVVSRLEKVVMEVARDPKVSATVHELGGESVGSSAEELKTFLLQLRPVVEQIFKSSGTKN